MTSPKTFKQMPNTATASRDRSGAPPLYVYSVFDGTPSGFRRIGPPIQGSSFLATLVWRTQSPWDWKPLTTDRPTGCRIDRSHRLRRKISEIRHISRLKKAFFVPLSRVIIDSDLDSAFN